MMTANRMRQKGTDSSNTRDTHGMTVNQGELMDGERPNAAKQIF